jgi:hypothetical protein
MLPFTSADPVRRPLFCSTSSAAPVVSGAASPAALSGVSLHRSRCPNFGDDSDPDLHPGYTVEEMTQSVLDLIDSLAPKPVLLVGSSNVPQTCVAT